MKQFLNRRATTRGGRDGNITSETSQIKLDMAKPVEMGGQDNTKTNPEEIFSMGYSACFASSLEHLLQHEKIAYEALEVTANTKLVPDGNQGFKFEIDLDVNLTGVDEKTRTMFIENAYQFCPYSKAINSNVEVNINIIK